MSDKLKRGRWSKIELKIITEQAGKIPVEEIAASLSRDVETVKNWIRENLAIDVSGDEPVPLTEHEIRNELKSTPDWEELKEQFVEKELQLFEYKYGKMMAQFKPYGDVLPTEETQIFLLIKLEILMNRNLKGRARALQDIERLEKEIGKIYEEYSARTGKSMDDQVRDRLTNLENQLISSKDAEGSKTREYVDFSAKHSTLMREMKATRDQRISRIENAKGSFLDLLKSLENDEIRKREGEDMEIMKLAVDVERNRLSSSHQYVDDSIDTPLLTPEVINNV
jgi:hypothetical protein